MNISINEDEEDKKDHFSGHTPEWLRSFDGCGHYTDAEATEILACLDILAQTLLLAGEQTNNSNTSTTIIPLNDPIKKKAA